MSNAEVLVGVRRRDRLAPWRPGVDRRWSRAMQVAVGIAIALHLLLAGVLLHPPAFLRGAPIAPPPPRMAAIEVQNDVPAAGDAAVGGKHQSSRAVPDTPPPTPAGQPPPDSPDAPIAKDADLPPPTEGQVSTLPPAPAGPQPQDQNAMPRISLDDEGDTGEESGGSAQQPAKPDPKMHNKLPRYPTVAARAGQSGEVDMVVTVQPDGTAGDVVIANSSGAPSLDAAAVRAVRGWKFQPARDHGQPITSSVPVRLNFVLNGG